MSTLEDSTDRLRVLNDLLGILNRTANVRRALGFVLEGLLEAMELDSGWIVLRDPTAQDPVAGPGFVLAAYHNLPSAMALDHVSVWERLCDCEEHCAAGEARRAHNEGACPRVERLGRETGTRPVHASAVLRARGRPIGVLNVAASGWAPLGSAALAFLDVAASELGEAISRSNAYAQLLSRRLDEQDVMLDLSRRLLGHGDLDSLTDPLLESTCKLLEADAAALLLPTPRGESLQFRATKGWRSDPAAEGRRLRMHSDCSASVAMRARRPILIKDLEKVPLAAWAASWIRTEGFRGHIALPLLAEDRAVGALVVNVRDVRRFGEQETRFLQLLANTAALAIGTAHLQEQAAERRRIEHELALAHDIQATLLPDADVQVEGWQVASSYEAAQEVGGDFYDVMRLHGGNRRLALVIGDVAGKSVSGAMLMALSLSAIREAAREHEAPRDVLTAVNRRVLYQTKDDKFVTALYGVLDADTGTLRYASAGHNAPVLATGDGARVEELPIRGIALGIRERPRIREFEIRIQPGDTLVLYTDGVTEALDARREMFGYERLFDAIATGAAGGAGGVRQEVLDRLALFGRGTRPSDDTTLLVVRRLPA